MEIFARVIITALVFGCLMIAQKQLITNYRSMRMKNKAGNQ
ncbi:hypothetical protein C7374_101449 [Falsochrobactrum ovis]|uniref:Uncharacterized protein n=1 Tax=Falsochrobactrum ovis TaxID=1293442 RepID=A0A364K007_9HYPH|nr:hypothetical protein C7374_101449 [Falsochrobactrum ovis]